MRMNDSDRWVNHNLQRQRELLEKQRQRKLQANLSCTVSSTNGQQRGTQQWHFSNNNDHSSINRSNSSNNFEDQTQNDRVSQSRGSLYSFMSGNNPPHPSTAQTSNSNNIGNNPFGSSIGSQTTLETAAEPKIITVKGITPPQSRKQSISSEEGKLEVPKVGGSTKLIKPVLNVEKLEKINPSFQSEIDDEESFRRLSIKQNYGGSHINMAQLSPASITALASKSPSWNANGEEDAGSISTEILNEEHLENIDVSENLEQFVMDPIRKNYTLKCRITRDKRGMDKGMYPIYYLHLEKNDGRRTFLLAARKRKKSTTANYLLSIDPTDLRRNGRSFIAKVRSNAMGTMFTIYDNGESPKKSSAIGDALRRELGAETNVLGLKGPRKMSIIIPGIYVDQKHNYVRPLAVRPISEKDSILERYKTNRLDEMVVLSNKQPVWNEDTQSYVLNFHGRVTQASVKNFQIVHSLQAQSLDGRHRNSLSADLNEYVIMQFGRIDNESFTMDVRYPLSPIQAFGIAMTSFHGKLACE